MSVICYRDKEVRKEHVIAYLRAQNHFWLFVGLLCAVLNVAVRIVQVDPVGTLISAVILLIFWKVLSNPRFCGF